jgi:long-chain acyl-CoA synthetase
MIAGYLRAVAGRHPDRLAIIDGDQRITYTELLARIDLAREWLRSTIDPRHADVIAAALDNSWQFVACLFAASELGCILTPCNPRWRDAELRRLAERLEFRGVVIEARLSAEWNHLLDLVAPERVLIADHFPAAVHSPNAASLSITEGDQDAPALYLATSGSTGAPRLVPRSHRNLIANAENVGKSLDIDPGRRMLAVVPFAYSNGVNNSLLVPLFAGATAVLVRSFNPGACAELVHREQVDTLLGSPFLYGALLEGVHDPKLLSSLRWCFTAGGRIPSAVVERWQDRFGTTIRQFYGMSELGVITLERGPSTPSSTVGTCVGEPLSGVEVAVFRADGMQLVAGEIGEIAARSAGVMSGYLDEPELSRTRFHDGYFCTGDLGYFDSSGQLYLTGRMGRVLNIAGVKVDPLEVERAVEQLSGVAFCHVDTVPNALGGDVIRARVVRRLGFQLTRREVIEQCRKQLAEYKFPRVIEFLDQSPATLAGKIPLHDAGRQNKPELRSGRSPSRGK